MKKGAVLFFTFLAIVIAFSGGILYYWIIMPSKAVIHAGEEIASEISDAFNFRPRVSIKNSVVFEEQANILEVAVYSRRLVYDYDYSDTWMGSTKELHLRGIYQAKYGFNLKQQNFAINITESDSNSGNVYDLNFKIPEPVLLSFETDNYHVIRDKEGWWNKFNENEREDAVNTMREAARIKALSVDYRKKVKDSIESQIKVMMSDIDLNIHIGRITFEWEQLPRLREIKEMTGNNETLALPEK